MLAVRERPPRGPPGGGELSDLSIDGVEVESLELEDVDAQVAHVAAAWRTARGPLSQSQHADSCRPTSKSGGSSVVQRSKA